VKKLAPVWAFSTGVDSGHQAPLLVNNGIMFVATPYNQVVALEAKTGKLLWRYNERDARGSERPAQHQSWCGPLRRQGLPRHARLRAGGARRQHRQGGLAAEGRGLEDRLLHDACPARRQGQGHGRRLGRRVRRPRLHHGLRRQQRTARVEDVHGSRAGREGQRDLDGRHLEERWRVRLDHRDVRPGA